MKIFIGLLLIILGLVILIFGNRIFGNRQFGKYGPISKWLFDPPYKTEEHKKFINKTSQWIVVALLIYFGSMVLLGKM